MNPISLTEVTKYVNDNINEFHNKRIELLGNLKLSDLLEKNPYLFRAKNIVTAAELIEGTLTALLSSSEEKLFGDFLEGLAIFIAEKTTGGRKSASQGVDLEFTDDGTTYVVAIKSGPNWGNSSQHAKLAQDLTTALTRLRQNKTVRPDSVLGICYGKTRSARNTSGYLKLVGQNFWTFISGNKDLYTDIIEPLGYRAQEHNDKFAVDLANAKNRLTAEFLVRFGTPDGSIDWKGVVQGNSGNYDLYKVGIGEEPPAAAAPAKPAPRRPTVRK